VRVRRLSVLATALATALALALSAGAAAQTDPTQVDPGAPELQGTPPPLEAPPQSEAEAGAEETPAGQLPNTGGRPGLVFLAGAGLLLTGLGLRLREQGA